MAYSDKAFIPSLEKIIYVVQNLKGVTHKQRQTYRKYDHITSLLSVLTKG
jgi:hypothetical protein